MPTPRIACLASWFVLSVLACPSARCQPPKRPAGEKYALVVGVRQYDPNELRNLPYSEPDVVELAAVLKAAGYRRVVVMTQTEGAANARFLPTAANIRKSLRGILEDRDPSDSVVLAFAGHGIQPRGGKVSYFCPMDARTADLSTLISFDDVYRAVEQSRAGVKLLIADACRNDPQSDNSRSRALVQLESVTRPQLQRPPGGVMALFSCSPGERAFEASALKHGVFFHFVIQGLKGEADLDKDGTIEIEELALFTKRRVPDFVKDEYGDDVRQMPVLRGEVGGRTGLVDLHRPLARATKPNLFILAVGVSSYRLVPAIEFGASDARDASRMLAENARSLFASVETKLLIDDDATRIGVVEGLNWLRGNVTANDVGVFLFSGREGKPVAGRHAMMSVDAGFEDAITTGVAARTVHDALSGASGRFLVLLDTCQSGAIARQIGDGLPNVAVLASAGDEELCFEVAGKVNAGLFTHALKEALSGKADADRDGLVDLAEVETYVARRVEALSRDHADVTRGKLQHPVARKSQDFPNLTLARP